MGRLFQSLMLGQEVGGLEEAAGEHEFPMDGGGLLLEGHDVELVGIIDNREAPLGSDDLGDGREVLLCLSQGGDVTDPRMAKLRQLGCQG